MALNGKRRSSNGAREMSLAICIDMATDNKPEHSHVKLRASRSVDKHFLQRIVHHSVGRGAV